MASRGAEQGGLLQDLRTQVTRLTDDLRVRSDEVDEYRAALEEEHADAQDRKRIAATFETWREERLTQVAVGWVLGTLFVRFCEDNELVEYPWIAGPGERLALAEARHEKFFQDRPHLNDRDWLIAAFDHLAECHPTAAGLFDRNHNPLWQVTPSYEAASELLRFWRRLGPDGELVHDLTRDARDTRFLGDLYQGLSEHAQKTYALLQTPEFVEEFILDLTLDPAVEEFGLEPELEVKDASGEVQWHHVGLRTIDPACGSGHFLLGLFHRLLKMHRDAAGTGVTVDDWALVRKALDSVHGCDKNPFAASIARFRLLVAVLNEADIQRLDQAPEFPIHVAVGDSLLHGRGASTPTEDLGLFGSHREMFTYTTEDVWEYAKSVDLLGKNSYHVVVGNPPYITVKDDQEKDNYRAAYDSCSGQYALSVPFAQRMFELATQHHRGFIGQITANSFMKREFGKKLIQEFFDQRVKLTHIIDASGAHIPGHGTPTVILAGRNTVKGWDDPIRTVLSVRGEPEQPDDPAQGHVWRAIVDQVGRPGSESQWVSVEDIERGKFAHFPWSLQGGGSGELFGILSKADKKTVSSEIRVIGRTTHTGSDEAYFSPPRVWQRAGVSWKKVIPLVEGTVVRDWDVSAATEALFPYGATLEADLTDSGLARHLWKHRSTLRVRREPGGTHEEIGLTWFEWSRWHPERFVVPLGIAFSFVATHNHFVLDRGGKVFNRSAPVIKLPENSTEDDHLQLLGVLNSSTACFWLKQVSQPKGGTDNSSGGGNRWAPERWIERYEFTGTKLKDFPLPSDLHLTFPLSRALDSLARELSTHEPSAVAERATPTRDHLDSARSSHESIRRRMIALQEELDWQVYGLYGLLKEHESAALVSPDFDEVPEVPEVNLGERAFEIVLARKMANEEAETVWFSRHNSTPITEIPSRWPAWYQDVVQARIDVIEKRRDIGLIERPECKRRWSLEPWEKREREALRSWLLDRCEEPSLWFGTRQGLDNVPRPMAVPELADALATSPGGDDVVSVAELYAADHLGRPDIRLSDVLRDIVADQHVPHLAALRYKDSGMRKRAQWEDVWEQQRKEDRTGERLDIAVPPKYVAADFRRGPYWSNRGKLDVPKERFVSYPDCGPASDRALVLGWAGWDHLKQAEALMALVEDRVEHDQWGGEQLAPLLAGVLELLPWLRQWHGEYDDEWEGSPAGQVADWLADQREQHHFTEDDLRTWRPVPARKGRAADSS